MPEAVTQTASVARCTTPAWSERFCRYDHDFVPTRRTSPSRLHEARERVSFPCGYALWLLHEPPVQMLRANRIGIGIPCIYSQAPGPETRELSRVPLRRACLSPFRSEGVPGHRAGESADPQEARTGAREDTVCRSGLLL